MARRNATTKVAAQTADNSAVEVANRSEIAVKMRPVAELHPSPNNPNVMSAEDFAAFVAEVKRTQKLPKPVVVVPKGKKGFTIVDGEHGWRAGKEAGLTEIPCEIITADKFEQMRQMVLRNRHGENHPVLLGWHFQKMLEEGELTNRQLAKEIYVSEGTVRTLLKFAEAAEVRSRYAKDAVEKIGELTGRKVDVYLKMPAEKRDAWLDAGADMNDPDAVKAARDNAKKPASAPAEQAADEDKQTAVSPEQAPTGEDDQAAASQEQTPTGESRPISAIESILGIAASNDVVPDGGGGAVTEDVGNGQADNDVGERSVPDARTTAGNDTSTPSSMEVSDEEALRELERFWDYAAPDAQRVFLTGILSVPDVLTMALEIVKQQEE